MSSLSKAGGKVWLVILVGAVAGWLWLSRVRLERVNYVSGLVEQVSPASNAGSSLAGYDLNTRELIIPERTEEGFHWIAQTQQMFAQGEWRVRRVSYDNAPNGRFVASTSLYRWWLGAVAWVDHHLSGRPLGRAVEHAARFAEPLLHGLLLVGATVLVAWRWGNLSAGLVAVGLVTWFPWAASFLPGVPTDRGLATGLGLASIVFLLIGVRPGAQAKGWFALAGVTGGIGIWADVTVQVPLLIGVLLGAGAGFGLARRDAGGGGVAPAWPWRWWGLSGAATVLAGYLAEYFPSHLGAFRLESINPLYGVAWLGAAELLEIVGGLARKPRQPVGWQLGLRLVWGIVGVAALPVGMKLTDSQGFLVVDAVAFRLTNLPDAAVAPNCLAWLRQGGLSGAWWAAVLPLLALGPVGFWLGAKRTAPAVRCSLALALGPVVVALGFASQRLHWWALLEGTLMVLIGFAAAATGSSRRWRLAWIVLVGGPGVVGWLHQWPSRPTDGTVLLTSLESQQLVERHLAHWLAKRTAEPGAVVYAPPHQALALSYYGGLAAIGTFAPENREGFGASLFIAAANTMEEIQELVHARGVRYIVVPSWDPFFDEYARRYFVQKYANRVGLLIPSLRDWNLPAWLRPLPYEIPLSGGFAGQSVLVFEVVEDQSPVLAASRLVEYLVETGRLDAAAKASETLRRFPGDLGALAARAQLQTALGEAGAAAQTVAQILPRLNAGADRNLPWDRRVSLAVVLARGEQLNLAQVQVRRCLTEINASRIRALSTGSLYTLLTLSQALNVPIADPALRNLALELLPPDLRAGL